MGESSMSGRGVRRRYDHGYGKIHIPSSTPSLESSQSGRFAKRGYGRRGAVNRVADRVRNGINLCSPRSCRSESARAQTPEFLLANMADNKGTAEWRSGSSKQTPSNTATPTRFQRQASEEQQRHAQELYLSL